jgi:phage-related protein
MDLVLLKEGAAFTLYALKTGNSVDEFLGALPKSNPAEFARIMRRLVQMADHGPSRKKEEFNDLGDGLYEAKSKGGTRVVFFYDGNHLVLCAHGFMKQSQKTPLADIATARQRRTAYLQTKAAGPSNFRIILTSTQQQPKRLPQ